jgi:hypothetical protein
MPPVTEVNQYSGTPKKGSLGLSKSLFVFGLLIFLCIGIGLGFILANIFHTSETPLESIAVAEEMPNTNETAAEIIEAVDVVPERPYVPVVSEDGSTLMAKGVNSREYVTLVTVPGGHDITNNFVWLNDLELVFEVVKNFSSETENKIINIDDLKNIIDSDYLTWFRKNKFYWVEWSEIPDQALYEFTGVERLLGESLYVNPWQSEVSKDVCFYNVNNGTCSELSLRGTFYRATTTADYVHDARGYGKRYVFSETARTVLGELGFVEIGGSDGLPHREHRFYQKVNGNIGQTVAVLDWQVGWQLGPEQAEDSYREFWFFFSDPYTFDDDGWPVQSVDEPMTN